MIGFSINISAVFGISFNSVSRPLAKRARFDRKFAASGYFSGTMSRVIVKNLPKKMSEERLREIFSAQGEITDIRMVKTPGGLFRRFAFVGYKTEKHAETAVKFFDKSFIDTSKLEVVISQV